jgi:hypothetical protein
MLHACIWYYIYLHYIFLNAPFGANHTLAVSFNAFAQSPLVRSPALRPFKNFCTSRVDRPRTLVPEKNVAQGLDRPRRLVPEEVKHLNFGARGGWFLKNSSQIFVYGGPRRLLPGKFSQVFCPRCCCYKKISQVFCFGCCCYKKISQNNFAKKSRDKIALLQYDWLNPIGIFSADLHYHLESTVYKFHAGLSQRFLLLWTFLTVRYRRKATQHIMSL